MTVHNTIHADLLNRLFFMEMNCAAEMHSEPLREARELILKQEKELEKLVHKDRLIKTLKLHLAASQERYAVIAKMIKEIP